MSGTPEWKVYNASKEYIAACKYSEDAAALVSCNGEGGTIRHGHGKVLWTEGAESFSAGDSYDETARVVMERHQRNLEAAYIKAHGKLPDGYRTV